VEAGEVASPTVVLPLKPAVCRANMIGLNIAKSI